MAKKTRKVLKQESQQRAIQQAANNVNAALSAPASTATTEKAPAVARAPKSSDLASEDFRYVKADLRRIGILAGSFTAILVILSFFIR